MRDVTTDSHTSDRSRGDDPSEVPSAEPTATPAAAGEGRSEEWHDPLLVEARGRRWGLWLGLLGGAAVLTTAGVLMATSLPGGTTLAGVAIQSVDDAPAALAEAAGALAAQPIRLATDAGTEVVLTGAELGLDVDVADSLAPVGDGLPSLTAWATRVGGPLEAPLEVAAYETEVLGQVAADITAEPVNAEVDVQRNGIETTPGVDGLDVGPDDVAAALDQAVATLATAAPGTWPDVVEVTVGGTTTVPPVTQADIDGIADTVARLEAAEVAVAADVVVPDELEDDADGEATLEEERTRQEITLAGHELRSLVGVEAVPDAPEGQRLALVPNPGGSPPRLNALMDLARIAPVMTAHIEDRSPTPAQGEDSTDVSEITGEVVVDEVQPGFEPDVEATLAQVIDAALAGGGSVEVVGDPDATVTPEDIGIREPISSFTTYYTAGQSRVTNIRRFAEIVDGYIIPPGESFEINHYVGRRTPEKGFVGGGAIQNGELVTEFGGGVSQFSTTFFNAAWFAGVELVDFKAHSVYFSRYPPGREATLNWPDVNNEIRNDTPYAILVDTHSTATSVTVTFWSTPYWDVQTIMGPCGCGGAFTVTNQRIITPPGGESITEEYTTIYTVLQNND